MTRENIIKKYKWLCFLASGKFTERDFDAELEAKNPDDSGRHIQGKLTPERVALIISDAKRHKENLEKKHPWVIEEPEKKTDKSKENKKDAK